MAPSILVRLATRNLLRHRRRSFYAIVSVSIGIAALIIATGYVDWMFYDFREAIIDSRYAHIQVTRPGYHENGRADPRGYLLPADDAFQDIPSKIPLRAWGPRLALTGLISKGDATLPFLGEGFDPGQDLTGDRALRIVQGQRLRSGDGNSIMLGQGLAAALGAKAGDNVVVLVDNATKGLNAVDAMVAASFESVSKAYDDSAILLPIGLARRLAKTDGANSWFVYLERTALTQQTAKQLRQTLDPRQYEVRTWSELSEFFNRAVDLFDQQLAVVRYIVIAIILLGIGNTMMMSVMERTGEIGTALALGIGPASILRQFLLEGSLIGALGGMLGLSIAGLASIGLDFLHIPMPPPPSLTRGYIAGIMITPAIVLEAMTVALATTTVATLYPAWKASRMNIVDAIRHNR